MPIAEKHRSKGECGHIRTEKATDKKTGKQKKNYRPNFYDFPLSAGCPSCQSGLEDADILIKKTMQGSKKIRRCKKCKTLYRTTGKDKN